MIQKPKSIATYQAEILTALAETGIRQLAPGGKARAFADLVASKMGELETQQFLNLSDTLLPFAMGSSLDMIGEKKSKKLSTNGYKTAVIRILTRNVRGKYCDCDDCRDYLDDIVSVLHRWCSSEYRELGTGYGHSRTPKTCGGHHACFAPIRDYSWCGSHVFSDYASIACDGLPA